MTATSICALMFVFMLAYINNVKSSCSEDGDECIGGTNNNNCMNNVPCGRPKKTCNGVCSILSCGSLQTPPNNGSVQNGGRCDEDWHCMDDVQCKRPSKKRCDRKCLECLNITT